FGLRRITESTITLFLILSPCLLVFYGQAIWQAMKYENSKPLASPARGAQKNRIVWVIFDELDQHLAFVNRPPSLHLPEFDRLRGEALVATNAVAPADETLLSLPSLTIGRLVDKAEPISEDELAIRFHKSGETAHWSTQPTIFSQAREKGQNTAIIGWYLPYCRLFNRVTTKCYGDSARNMVDSRDERIIYNMLQLSASSLEAVPLVKRLSGMRLQSIPRGDAETVEGLILSYVGLLKESLSAVADPNLGLIFVHLSVPHPPTFFDREAGVFSSRKANSYLDGLALADRTLGDIRHAMEGAGVWDDTVVLISSDHPWRRNMWYGKKYYFNEEDESLIVSENQRRVPFILKLAGQSKAKVYESSFNTVLSKDLLLAIMQGEVANSESVVEWLETSKTRFAFDMAK
ncbi:MAG TPA: sulfatase-like hydrolase/transferase, partial [Pyrinomonadaceae bacterium]